MTLDSHEAQHRAWPLLLSTGTGRYGHVELPTEWTPVCADHINTQLLLLTAVAARWKGREVQIHHIWTVTHRGTEGQHQTGRCARGYGLESEAATPHGTSMQVSSLGIL